MYTYKKELSKQAYLEKNIICFQKKSSLALIGLT